MTKLIFKLEKITYKQHIDLDYAWAEAGLSCIDQIILGHLSDRMKSSIKNIKYYDTKQGAYFVSVSREEVQSWTNIKSPTTISTHYKTLEDAGWIKREEIKIVNASGIKRINHFFLPKFDGVLATQRPVFIFRNGQKLSMNHSIIISSQFINRVNTGITSLTSKNSSSKVNPIDQWKAATMDGYHFQKDVVNSIANFVHGNVTQAKAIVKAISKARGCIAKSNDLVGKPEAQFESNSNIINGLGLKLDHIFAYIKSKKQITYMGTLVVSLKRFFSEAMGLSKDVIHVSPKNNKHDYGRSTIKETLPNWTKNAEDQKFDKQAQIKIKKRVALLTERADNRRKNGAKRKQNETPEKRKTVTLSQFMTI